MAVRTKRECDWPTPKGVCGKDASVPITAVVGKLKFNADYCTDHDQDAVKALLNVLGATVTSAIADHKARAVMVAEYGAHFSTSDARPWLMEQGHDVGPRGRVPGHLLDLYAAAH